MVEVGVVFGESFDPFKQRCNHGVYGLVKVIKGNIKSQTVNPAPTIVLRSRVQTNAERHPVAVTPTERLKQDATALDEDAAGGPEPHIVGPLENDVIDARTGPRPDESNQPFPDSKLVKGPVFDRRAGTDEPGGEQRARRRLPMTTSPPSTGGLMPCTNAGAQSRGVLQHLIVRARGRGKGNQRRADVRAPDGQDLKGFTITKLGGSDRTHREAVLPSHGLCIETDAPGGNGNKGGAPFVEQTAGGDEFQQPRDEALVVRVGERCLLHGTQGSRLQHVRREVGCVPNHGVVELLAAPLVETTVNGGPRSTLVDPGREPVLGEEASCGGDGQRVDVACGHSATVGGRPPRNHTGTAPNFQPRRTLTEVVRPER